MKAYVLHSINDLRYEEVSVPDCPPNWSIVKVMAAGICSSDIARVYTKGTYHFPTIPGHEFSGVVEKVGSKEHENLIGKKVGVFPLIPCRECAQCQKKHYEMCSHYDYVGSRRDGGFAEYVAVPIWNLLPLDNSVPYTSAAMLEPLSVALHAVKLGKINSGDRVCVIGTGMIGISAAQWAKKFSSSNVTIIGRNENKRKIVEACGIEYVTDKDVSGKNYDFVLEAVGTPSSIELAIQVAAPGGKVVFMGNPSGDILLKQDTYWKILRKQLNVQGTWNSSYDGPEKSDWTEAVDALGKGEIDVTSLVSHEFTQEHLVDGLSLMRDHKEPYCKVMTIWNVNPEG